ncbi:MAG: Calx-beta domain-containing protein [Elainella sp.]
MGRSHSSSHQLRWGCLTFAPGDIQKSISVSIPADRKREIDETFRLNLTNPTAATIATGEAVGTITNDDPIPTLSINSISLKEGNTDTTTALFTVSLSAASSQSVSVEYATVDGTATLAEDDYQSVTQTLIFAPGETSKTIPVLINGDLTVEPNETFSLTLVNPQNATLDQASGTATLENDDVQPGSLPQSSAGQNFAASSYADTAKAEQVTGDATDNQIQGGAGNDRLDGAAGDDIISGGDGDDILYGREGNDRLLGGDGDDTLYGGRSQDEVTGGQGKDLLYGGRGDDLLVGSAGGDELYGREGNDRLLGKQGNDFLGGGTGRDQLTGGIGQDRLRGGKGRDQFQFFNLEEQGDFIGDFSVKQDLLVISAGGFAGLKTGSLRQNQFQLGQTALDAEDRFIYNGATGALYFDADGSGSSQQILLATFSNRAALSFEAVRIVA